MSITIVPAHGTSKAARRRDARLTALVVDANPFGQHLPLPPRALAGHAVTLASLRRRVG
jgi:hypothetical protein